MTEALEKKDAPADAAPVQCCGLCNAWLDSGQVDARQKVRLGICRAHPPTVFLMQGPPHPLSPQQPTMQAMAQFPPMPENGYCRDFEFDGEDDAADAAT